MPPRSATATMASSTTAPGLVKNDPRSQPKGSNDSPMGGSSHPQIPNAAVRAPQARAPRPIISAWVPIGQPLNRTRAIRGARLSLSRLLRLSGRRTRSQSPFASYAGLQSRPVKGYPPIVKGDEVRLRDLADYREGRSMAERDPKDWPQRLQDAGWSMQRLGWSLTWSLTAPIIGFTAFGWIGLAVGLLLGMLILGIARARTPGESMTRAAPVVQEPQLDQVPQRQESAARNPCPRCGESIPTAAMVCRFCGLDLVAYDEDVLGTPEGSP